MARKLLIVLTRPPTWGAGCDAANRTLDNNIMNWTQVEGQWNQITGHLKSKWAKLTDDDLKNVAGKKEQLVGKLQERYGILKDEAEKQVDEWISGFSPKRDKQVFSRVPKSTTRHA